jgi:hypothetical protein
MTIDDFDVNEISDRLAIREDRDEPHALQALHDDGHNDFAISGCYHNDVTNSPFHDDAQGCNTHDDAHNDVEHDDACPGYRICPV